MTDPDPIAELKTLIEQMGVKNQAMHEAAASRMAIDARAHADQVATMRAEVTTRIEALGSGLTRLHAEFVEVKATADGASAKARDAMQSYDQIQTEGHEQWRGVIAGQELDRLRALDLR